MTNARAEFWSKVADKYDRVADLQFGGNPRSLVRERLEREGKLGRVVEFGCGTGYFSEVLASKADSVLATDISSGMIDVAKQRVRAPNVAFDLQDCQHTSLADGSFDTAFIGLVIHFTEPARTAAEMHRILRSEGTLIVANVNPKALGGLARMRSLVRMFYHGITGYRTKPPRELEVKMLTARECCEVLSQARFRIDEVETFRDSSRASSIPIDYIRATRMA